MSKQNIYFNKKKNSAVKKTEKSKPVEFIQQRLVL